MTKREELQIEMYKHLIGGDFISNDNDIAYSIKNKHTGEIICFYPDGRIYAKTSDFKNLNK